MKRICRGYTLIETLVVLSLTAVTLLIVAVTMHTLYRAEHQVRDDLQGQRTLDQLATQLRWDAHAALSSAAAGGADASQPRVLTLTLIGGRSIQYSFTANSVERVVRRNDAVEHREGFRLALPDSYWSIDTARDRPLLTLHLVHRDSRRVSSTAAMNEQVIRAAVGVAGEWTKK